MNYKKLFILLAIMTSLSISAHDVRLLRSDEIATQAVVIGNNAARDKYCLMALTALGYAQNVYVLYPFFRSFFYENSAIKPVISLCDECEKKTNASVSLKEAIINFCCNSKELLTTLQGWETIGRNGLYYGGQLSALFIMQRVYQNLMHPDTLRWYVHMHAPYQATTEMMKELVKKLQYEAADVKRADYNKQLLQGSCDRLARYGELICAYITYKSVHLDTHERAVGERVARYIFNYHNDWLVRVYEQLESNNPCYDELEQLIDAYEAEIACQLRYFFIIEDETSADRRALREML